MSAFLNFLKKEFSGWTKFEISFIFIFLPLIFIISYIANDIIFSTISAVFGLLYTIIAGKGKISCYFFGIIGTLCYSYLSFKNALYGNLLLYAGYYLPMEIIGIFCWARNINKVNGEIRKTFLSPKERLLFVLLIIIASVLFSFVLKIFHDKFPVIDAFVTVLSITGMILTVKRCIEQWIIWTIANFLSVIMWFFILLNGAKTFATLLMWLIYLFLGIYFYYKWYREIFCQNRQE